MGLLRKKGLWMCHSVLSSHLLGDLHVYTTTKDHTMPGPFTWGRAMPSNRVRHMKVCLRDEGIRSLFSRMKHIEFNARRGREAFVDYDSIPADFTWLHRRFKKKKKKV